MITTHVTTTQLMYTRLTLTCRIIDLSLTIVVPRRPCSQAETEDGRMMMLRLIVRRRNFTEQGFNGCFHLTNV